MIGATVCSGLGCPEAAMPEWDWVLASEIETAPRAVMAYRHGAEDARYSRQRTGPALWGDFTTIRVRHFRRLGIPLPEWIVGGLPCQAFSIAGLRQSLGDARGNLTLEFLHLVHSLRRAGSLKGILFENVPGILSTPDNAFGCFLAGLVGADDALRSPFERGRWPDEGMVEGPRARAAWRIRDAQYDGLAQRRERVFVVASFVEEIDPAAILFERLGLHGNPAPRREKGQSAAGTLSARTEGGGGLGTDFDLAGGLQPVQAFGGGNRSGPIQQAACLTAKGQRVDFEVETFVTHALRGEGFDASEDGTGRGTPIVPIQVHPTLNAGGNSTGGPRQPGMSADTADGLIPIAFSSKDYGNDATEDLSPTLRSMNHDGSHANGGGQVAVAFMENQRGEIRTSEIAAQITCGGGKPGQGYPAVAFDMRGREGGAHVEGPHDTANIRAASGGSSRPYVAEQWAVRRLMPLECERLQGFDDGFTAIPYRKRKIAADEAEQSAIGGAKVWQEGEQWFTDCMADGPRYKMIGNSMARPVIRWILSRVERQLSKPEVIE